MFLVCLLYFVAGALAAGLVFGALGFVFFSHAPVATLGWVLRYLRQARFRGESLEQIIETIELMHRRLATLRG